MGVVRVMCKCKCECRCRVTTGFSRSGVDMCECVMEIYSKCVIYISRLALCIYNRINI